MREDAFEDVLRTETVPSGKHFALCLGLGINGRVLEHGGGNVSFPLPDVFNNSQIFVTLFKKKKFPSQRPRHDSDLASLL